MLSKERMVLARLARGDSIVFSQDGDTAWFSEGDRGYVGDEVMSLREKGFTMRVTLDDENYRGMSERDVISDAGREYLNESAWITHNGQGAPDLPPGTRVQVRLRDGVFSPVRTVESFRWEPWDDYPEYEIVAYRVVPDER